MFDEITSSQSNTIPDFSINYNVNDDVHDKDVIELPLYSNSSREHLLCMLKMQTNVAKDAIILAGVALIVPE